MVLCPPCSCAVGPLTVVYFAVNACSPPTGLDWHSDWSSWTLRLVESPVTSRHSQLFSFWNCQVPSGSGIGIHRLLAVPFWVYSTIFAPAAVEALATTR